MHHQRPPSGTVGAQFVDVREPLDAQAPAFEAPEAVNLPFKQLPQDRELVLVCQNGDKSAQATGFVRAKGNVHVSPMCTG